MSEIEYERSEDVVGDGDGDGPGSRDDHRKKKKGEHGFGGNLRKAKRVALFRFRKVEKQLQRRNKKSSNPSSSTPGCLGKRVVGGGGDGGGGGGGGGCGRGGGYYCCFKQTPTSDSPVESPTSDPNSSEFTYELLRALIETNDFYSKECNTHLDVDNMDDKLEE